MRQSPRQCWRLQLWYDANDEGDVHDDDFVEQYDKCAIEYALQKSIEYEGEKMFSIEPNESTIWI